MEIKQKVFTITLGAANMANVMTALSAVAIIDPESEATMRDTSWDIAQQCGSTKDAHDRVWAASKQIGADLK